MRRPRRIVATAAKRSGDSDYEPGALVNCGQPMADDAIAAPNPVVVVEVLSPGTGSTDTGAKLADYFLVRSIVHYLIVHAIKRTVIHHQRTGEGIQTRSIVDGPITMDPPGSSQPSKKSTKTYNLRTIEPHPVSVDPRGLPWVSV